MASPYQSFKEESWRKQSAGLERERAHSVAKHCSPRSPAQFSVPISRGLQWPGTPAQCFQLPFMHVSISTQTHIYTHDLRKRKALRLENGPVVKRAQIRILGSHGSSQQSVSPVSRDLTSSSASVDRGTRVVHVLRRYTCGVCTYTGKHSYIQIHTIFFKESKQVKRLKIDCCRTL